MVTATPPKKQPAQNVRVIGKDTTNKTPFERRKEGVTGILQMIATPMAFVPTLLPDAAVIARYGEEVGTEAAAIAAEDERVARVLDRISSMGPYSRLCGLVFAMGAQIAANHGLITPGMFGTLPPDQFVDTVAREQEGGDGDQSTHPGGRGTPASVPAT